MPGMFDSRIAPYRTGIRGVRGEESELRARSVLVGGFRDGGHFRGIATGEDETVVASGEMVSGVETNAAGCAGNKDCFVCHIRHFSRGPRHFGGEDGVMSVPTRTDAGVVAETRLCFVYR